MSDQERENKKTEQTQPRHNTTEKEQGRTTYRFMDQMIKKRPVRHRSIVLKIAGMLGSGIVIGLVASLVFTLTQPVLRQNTVASSLNDKVTIPAEEQLVEDEIQPEPETEGSENALEQPEAEMEQPEEGARSSEEGRQTPETAVQEDSETPVTAAGGESGTSKAAERAEEPGTEAGQNGSTAEAAAKAAEPETGSGQEKEQSETEARQAEDQPGTETGQAEEQPDDTETKKEDGLPDGEEKEAGSRQRASVGITPLEYRQLYRDMMQVAEEPERALVQVIGITSELDYFNQNYENQRRISGLTVAMTDTDLFILTEYRVVEEVERIQIVFSDGTMTDAVFQKADPNTGLAIVKVPLESIGEVNREKIAIAPLGNSSLIHRGDPVLAVGSPLGVKDSVAFGIITSTGSREPAADSEYLLLNTDIEGSADGSGVLIDLDGKIVGIISRNFGNNTGTITGLAISQLKEIIEGLSNNEDLNYVGILGQDVTQDISERTGIPRGLLVTGVEEESPAMLAGLKPYDVIVKIGVRPVYTLREYHQVLRSLEADERVSFTAMRRGKEGYAEVNFKVTVEGR